MAANDDFSSDINTAGKLSPGGQTQGVLESGKDSDWFKITLTAGQYYRFEFASSDSTYRPFDQEFSIYDSNGTYLWKLGSRSVQQVELGAYKPAVSGDYYIAVNDRFGGFKNPIPYTLKADTGTVDAVGDTPKMSTPLEVGKTTRGTFDYMYDNDVYKLTLPAGTTYVVTPDFGVVKPGQYINTDLRIEDAGNTLAVLTRNDTPTISFATTVAGDYYIRFAGDDRALVAPVGYALTVNPAADDFIATAATTGTIALNANTAGSLETGGDRDWFATTLEAGNLYWLTLAGQDGGVSYGATIKLFDADSNMLASEAVPYGSQAATLTLPYAVTRSGKYYVEVSDRYFNATGKYSISASLGIADDYGNSYATATTIPSTGKVTGNIELQQDTDVLKIAVTKGKTYLFALDVNKTTGAPKLSLSGSRGADYAQDTAVWYDKPGTKEYRVYTASETGDYYLTVTNAAYGTAGYTVGITEVATDDYGNNRSASGALQVGNKASGKIDYTGDSDWIKVAVDAGNKYAFTLQGAGSGEGTLQLNANGADLKLLGSGTNTSAPVLKYMGNGVYVATPTSSGDYYAVIQKGPFDATAQSDATGTYTLQALSLSNDKAGPVIKSAAPASGAALADLYDSIAVTFDEAIYLGSGYVRLLNGLGEHVESLYLGGASAQASGTQLILNPSSRLKPGMKYLLDFPTAGEISDLAGNKYTGSAQFSFTTVQAVDQGGNGNDYLIGLSTGLGIDGGAGTDSTLYAGYRSSYTITRGATASTVQRSGSSGSGTADKLVNIERLLFDDTAVALDTSGAGGQAYRLYQAAFNRTPDKVGVGYWIAQIDKGASLRDVAQGFINSTEFKTQYGSSLSDAVFVDKLYQNVLHRAGEQAGVAYWNKVLADGASRADVLAYFSEGPENQAAVLQVIGNGFDYIPYG